ncbi:pyruvate dehydrogenase E2 component [Spiroplasma chinense]|uniref:Dihydrolipoamide acetyltransferase component of pyruvate dehydrogenase complex n=1 Tax=Spiroplasma chinense TaxID=216932 RepID=A0A5B9Y4D0_9MOLU|nr:dihydrolipoamide acetyltransferase family protein [Spiroplasma chinense]QEH62028.1 pyruvate dehydrogenase E2 component [Spiroplasma chinense]
MFKVKFADIGEGLTEGTVQEIYIKIGDVVKMGDPLFNVETDKVTSDIFAPTDGAISKINVEQGLEIKVGDVVVEIDDGKESEVSQDVESKVEEVKVEEIKVEEVKVEEVKVEVESVSPSTSNENQNNLVWATPLARKTAKQLGIDISLVTPTGKGGKTLLADVENYNKAPSQVFVTSTLEQKPQKDYSNPLIDVPSFDNTLTFSSMPMNQVRKATIKAMERSHSEIAAFTGMRNLNVTELVKLRTQLKEHANNLNIKLTYLAFIVKAVALCLKQFPNINSRINKEKNTTDFVNQINIGIACDTPEGLMVPVIKDADKLSVYQLAIKINELSVKAKNKSLSMKEISGASFTVTNFGSVGLEYATPIINFPESAILGLGVIKKEPAVKNQEIIIQDIMPISISADHRIIDGADAGRFLISLENYLINPATLLI